MTKLSPSEQIIAEKTVCILLIRGQNAEGQGLFAYLAVRADRLQEFMEAQKSGTFFPEDYGVVLESGVGEPSDEIKAKMTKEYGFNHDAMANIDGPADAHDLASNISSIIVSANNKNASDA